MRPSIDDRLHRPGTRVAVRSTVGSGEGNHCHRGVRPLQSAMPIVHLARQTLGAANASGRPFDRTHVREGTSGNVVGGMRCASLCRGVDGVRSADRDASAFHRSNAGPGPPRRRDRAGGGRSTPSLGSSLADRGGTWPGCTNFNVIPATSSSSGVSRAHPWTGRRAAGSSPRRPRNDRTVACRRTPA